MKCQDFKNLFEQFVVSPTQKARESKKYLEWCRHMNICSECSDWYQMKIVQSRGADPAKYPCVHVAYHSVLECDIHKDAWECADTMLVREKNVFGLPVRDGGGSFIEINFCPWCGIKLSGFKRPTGRSRGRAQAARP